MGLQNTQYQKLARMYDERRQKDHAAEESRKKEAYAAIPELAEIDQAIITGSIAAAKQLLSGEAENTGTLGVLRKENAQYSARRKELLRTHGYPEDWLEPVYFCPDCRDTGILPDGKHCHCFQQAAADLLFHQSNLSEVLKEENFDHFDLSLFSDTEQDPELGLTPREAMEQALEVIRHFLDCFGSEYENILLLGNTGVGKTFLANCAASELLSQGYTVVYFSAPALFDLISRNRFGRGSEDYIPNEQLEYVYTSDLLILDDLGTELSNAFVSSELYRCINDRHLARRPTLISSNLSWEDLSSRYSERVFSRLASNYRLLTLVGCDIRLKKAIDEEKSDML